MPTSGTTASEHTYKIGLISDTHGLLRPEALAALHGSDFIVHAGDIGHADILTQLARAAPVTAVRGNNDMGAWAADIPETNLLQVGAIRIYVLHNLDALDVDPVAAGLHVVVAGHSHRPSHVVRDGVHFINPGSAGPRRFRLPISVGVLRVAGTMTVPELLELD